MGPTDFFWFLPLHSSPFQLTTPTRLSVNNSLIRKVVGYLDKTFCDVYMLLQDSPPGLVGICATFSALIAQPLILRLACYSATSHDYHGSSFIVNPQN